jgi:hypothetical protein
MKHKQKPKLVQPGRMPIYDMILFPGIKKEDPVKSAQSVKYLYSALSAMMIILFMFISFRVGIMVMESKLSAAEEKLIEKQQIINEVERVEKEMRRLYPKKEQEKLRQEAITFVGKTHAFEIPLRVAMVSAEAESCYNINAKGPFGERGTHQAMYATMRRYFPKCDGSLIYWEVASWLHLQDCFEKSGRNLYLTLAYHNSGTNRTPLSAYRVARKHVNRCRRIARGLSA